MATRHNTAMEQQILEIDITDWQISTPNSAWISALEAGKVLYFPHLSFIFTADEQRFLTPAIRDPKSRNISLDANGKLKGALGDAADHAALANMIGRFRAQAQQLIHSLLPAYQLPADAGGNSVTVLARRRSPPAR